MNRTILIVIVDFLLVSLVTFSRPDLSKMTGEEGKIQAEQEAFAAQTNTIGGGQDLANAMRVALSEEQKRREELIAELTRTRDTATSREQQVQLTRQELEAKNRETARLQEEQTKLQQEQAKLEQQRAALQHQYQAAQSSLEGVSKQLQSTSAEALLSKETIAALEAEKKRQSEDAEALKQQLNHLASSNRMVLNEKQQLAGQLQVAEVERRHALEQVGGLQEQVKVEREEKAKLADGVKTLAAKSSELTKEVRENRPLAPNTIFNDFMSNRVHTEFAFSKSGFFGNESVKEKQAEVVLINDGTNTFALGHVDNTPMSLWNPGTEWARLAGTFSRNLAQVPIRSVSFHLQDPRVIMMPVTAEEAKRLGGKVYHTSADPFKFQDAVLVGATEGYYGECRFEIDLATPAHLRLDRNVVKGIFGKFNPSRGDLVFSKSGELLGVMANNTYCLKITSFDSMATFQFNAGSQGTAGILSQLYNTVTQLPFKLQ